MRVIQHSINARKKETKIQLEIHWQKSHADACCCCGRRSCERTPKRECKRALSALTGKLITHTHRKKARKRVREQQEERRQTLQTQIQVHTTKLTTRLATGTRRGAGEHKNWSRAAAADVVASLSSTCCPLLGACSNKFQILTNKTMVL